MTKQTEALKLALEALEEAWYHVGTFQPTEKAIDLYEDARAAIKKALAQPEQEQQIETLKRCLFQMQEAAKDLVEQAKSLTPPQRTWVGLTQTEVVDLLCEYNKLTGNVGWQQLIYITEAKLKAKNT